MRRSPFALPIVALAACIASAQASPELDRQYALTTVGVLRSYDNVDGLFNDLVQDTSRAYLSKLSRFVVVDLAKANALFAGTKLPYNQVVDDPAVLQRLAQTYKLDTVVRTKVYKQGPSYRFTMDWVYAPKSQLIASESFVVDEPFSEAAAAGQGAAGSEPFRAAIHGALDKLVKKVPFQGMVTGRDRASVTVNLGERSGVRRGDTLVIGTLDEIKFHPLLKQIMDWRLTTTGKATVESVEDDMAFARIDVEEYGRQVARFQKVVQVLPAPERPVDATTTITDRDERARRAAEAPHIGYLSPGISLGSYSREASNAANSFDGGAFNFGFSVEGQLWFTSEWFGEIGYRYQTGGYSQKDNATGQDTPASATASASQFRLAVGYFYHFSEDFFGPKAWGKIGFQNSSFSLPLSASELTDSTSVSSLTLGVGGELPLRDPWGALLDLTIGVFPGGSETGNLFGTVSGASSVDFFLGGYYALQPKIGIKGGLDFHSQSLDFTSGGNVSHKSVGLASSVLFYF